MSSEGESETEPEPFLLEMTPHLCNAAAGLMKVLTIPNPRAKTRNIEDILRQVRNPASMTGKQLFTLEQNFDRIFKDFQPSENKFLDLQDTVEAMFEPQSPPAPDFKSWGVTELIQSANLAYLGKWIAHAAQRDDPGVSDFLKALDNECPLPFLSSLIDGSSFGDSDLRDETFDFVLAVRAQLAVTELIHQSDKDGFDPENIIRSVFYAPLRSGGHAEETLRAWDLNGIGGGATGLLPEYESDIRQCIAAVQSNVTLDIMAAADGEVPAMQSLALKFPWSTFCVKTLMWIHERKQELDAKIMRLGGVSEIIDAVRQEVGLDATVLEPSPTKFDSFGSTLAAGSPKKSKNMNT